MRHLILAFLIMNVFAQSQKVPSDVLALIQAHMPNVRPAITELNYNSSAIREQFPTATSEGQAVVYKKDGHSVFWSFNEQSKVDQVTFQFNLKNWKSTSAERNLLIKYKNQLTPESFAKLPSDRRTLTVKDGPIEFQVVLPPSDYQGLMIRAITLHRKGSGR